MKEMKVIIQGIPRKLVETFSIKKNEGGEGTEIHYVGSRIDLVINDPELAKKILREKYNFVVNS